MATSRRNRTDSSGENSSDFSDSFSSDDDSHLEAEPKTILSDNSRLLWDLSGHISLVWKQVGRSVGIKECIIENIEIDYESEEEREKAYQLLLIWTRALGKKVTLRSLVNTLVYIGRNDIARAVLSNRKQKRFSVGSERAIKSEIKTHEKLQRQVLRKLKTALEFYQRSLEEMDNLQHVQHRAFEKEEAKEMKAKLDELDKITMQRKLDFLQEQISSMQGKDQEISVVDQQLRIVADKLYELDKTFKNYTEALDGLRVTYYSECSLGRFCYFRRIIFPRTSSSGKHNRRPSAGDEETDDEVFTDSPGKDLREHSESKTFLTTAFIRKTSSRSSLSKPPYRSKTQNRHAHEEHTKRKLSVSLDFNEQFQLEDFISKFCSRYRLERPFLYSHCFMNRDLQELRDPNAQPLSFIDPDTLPMPRYQSTEAIKSLVTNGNGTARGYVNVASVWI